MSDILRQIARTAVLCGALGLLLYLAVSAAVEYPVTAPLFGLVGATLVGIMTFGLLRDGWRTGQFPDRFGVTTREASPGWYWGSMLWYGACLVALAALALFCLLRIVGL